MKALLYILLFCASLTAKAQDYFYVLNQSAGTKAGCRMQDADAAAYIARVEAHGVTATCTQVIAVDSFFIDLKTNSLYTKLPYFSLPIWSNPGANGEEATGTAPDATWNGTVSHTSTGVRGDGLTGYANLNIPATSQSQNSAHLSFYNSMALYNSISQSVYIGAARTTSSTSLFYIAPAWTGGAGDRSGINVTSGINGPIYTYQSGFHITSRIGSTNFMRSMNGVVTQTVTSTSGTPTTQNIYLLARNTDGTAGFFSGAACSFWSVGAGLTSSEIHTLNIIVEKAMDKMGIGVQ